ncbi:MAG: phosphatidylserine decarboxylase family protein [Parafilimonas sp.]
MTIHKEGYKTIGISAFLFGGINVISFQVWDSEVCAALFLITLVLFLFIISFFRVPKRKLIMNDDYIISPADGRVVTIEEITDEEYFHDKRLQVSIFMSPLNVHLNRNPISGTVKYSKYYKGKYLVAWHPKSSAENERHSVVIENKKGIILVKQIAGALAKRIINYVSKGAQVIQTEELGFIKFGSRVDVLLPLHSKLKVKMNEKVKGGVSVLASFN